MQISLKRSDVIQTGHIWFFQLAVCFWVLGLPLFFGKQDLLDFLFRPGSCPTWLAVPPPASWSCRNGMGRGYGGGARFERSLRVTGAGAAEMAWEEATEGERGLSGR